jgi:hypothetical protein
MNKDIAWIIFLIVILTALWSFQDGTRKGEGGVFLEPKYNRQEYKIFQKNGAKNTSIFAEKQTKKSKTQLKFPYESVYKDKIYLKKGRASEINHKKEYIEIQASRNNQKLIPITNWVLKNSKNEEAKIGQGAYLVFSAQINPQRDILLEPGAKAFINTSRSPIGTNFRENACIGYFEQFQNFNPPLRKVCPRPYKDIPPGANLKDECLDYIERLPRCLMPINNIPLNLDDSCRKYLSESINYNACVINHRKDENFYSKDWRIYLGRDKELWKKKRETITLYDQLGKIVDSISY